MSVNFEIKGMLARLLDEGYVNTVENAEDIMVNMSEQWIESILG